MVKLQVLLFGSRPHGRGLNYKFFKAGKYFLYNQMQIDKNARKNVKILSCIPLCSRFTSINPEKRIMLNSTIQPVVQLQPVNLLTGLAHNCISLVLGFPDNIVCSFICLIDNPLR